MSDDDTADPAGSGAAGLLAFAARLSVGAVPRRAQVERYLDAVAVQVKLAMPGQSRGRIMGCTVDLTPADLYNVKIGYLNKRTFDWVAREDAEGVDVEGMVTIMRKHAKLI